MGNSYQYIFLSELFLSAVISFRTILHSKLENISFGKRRVYTNNKEFSNVMLYKNPAKKVFYLLIYYILFFAMSTFIFKLFEGKLFTLLMNSITAKTHNQHNKRLKLNFIFCITIKSFGL